MSNLKLKFQTNDSFNGIKIFKKFLNDVHNINTKTFVLILDVKNNKLLTRNTNEVNNLFQENDLKYDLNQIFDFDEKEVIKVAGGNKPLVIVIYNVKSFLKMLDMAAKFKQDVYLNLFDADHIELISVLDNTQNVCSFKKYTLTTHETEKGKPTNEFKISYISARIAQILTDKDRDYMVAADTTDDMLKFGFPLTTETIDKFKDIVNITENNSNVMLEFILNDNKNLDLYISDDIINCKLVDDIQIDSNVLKYINEQKSYKTDLILDKKNIFDFILSLTENDVNVEAVILKHDPKVVKLVFKFDAKNDSECTTTLTREVTAE